MNTNCYEGKIKRNQRECTLINYSKHNTTQREIRNGGNKLSYNLTTNREEQSLNLSG
jgi:hypothetical protein